MYLGGSSNSQSEGSGGLTPSLGGQIGLGPGGSLNPIGGFVPGGNPGQGGGALGPGGTISNPGGSNAGNGPFGQGSGGNGGNNGGSGIFGPGGSSTISGGNGGGTRPVFGPGGDNTAGGLNVIGGGGGSSSNNPDFGDPDVNCDDQGTCYDGKIKNDSSSFVCDIM